MLTPTGGGNWANSDDAKMLRRQPERGALAIGLSCANGAPNYSSGSVVKNNG